MKFQAITKSFFLTYLFLISTSLFGYKLELKSPSHAAYTHIYYQQHDSYNPAKSALPIYGKKGEKAQVLANKLKLFMDAKLLIIDTTVFPNFNSYRDSVTNRHIYLPFPEYPDIYLQRINGNWYYSPHTVSKIEELYESAVPFGSDLLRTLFGEVGNRDFLGLWAWQWFGALILITLVILVFKIQWWLLDKIVVGILFRKISVSDETKSNVHSFGKFGSVYLILHYTSLFIPALQLPVRANLFIMRGLDFTAIVFMIFLLFAAIDLFISRYSKFSVENTIAEQFRPVLQKLLKFAAVIFGVVMMLNSLGVNLGALLAGVSIAGLAIALAAQDTVKNVLGSVVIFLDQPFKVGDWIKAGETDGTVELVSLRATRIRTFENSVMYVPNGKLADAMINNYGLRVYRRFNTNIAITYDTSPELIEEFVKGLRDLVVNHPDTRKDLYHIYLNGFGDSSLNILFYIFFQVPEWKDELKSRHEIMLSIIELAGKMGVKFAFPTSTIHIENLHKE